MKKSALSDTKIYYYKDTISKYFSIYVIICNVAQWGKIVKKKKQTKKHHKIWHFKPDRERLNEYSNVGHLANHLEKNKFKYSSYPFF